MPPEVSSGRRTSPSVFFRFSPDFFRIASGCLHAGFVVFPTRTPPPMLKKILLGIAVVLVVFSIVVAMQPAAFQVVRNTTIAAPPAVVFAEVNDLHRWDA